MKVNLLLKASTSKLKTSMPPLLEGKKALLLVPVYLTPSLLTPLGKLYVISIVKGESLALNPDKGYYLKGIALQVIVPLGM